MAKKGYREISKVIPVHYTERSIKAGIASRRRMHLTPKAR